MNKSPLNNIVEPIKTQKTIKYLAGALAVFVLIAGLITYSANNYFDVSVDGRHVAYVQYESMVTEALATAQAQAEAEAGRTIVGPYNTITMTQENKLFSHVAMADELAQGFAAELEWLVDGTTIQIDGEHSIAMNSHGEAQQVLNTLTSAVLGENATDKVKDISFLEDVRLEDGHVRLNHLTDVASALAEINSGREALQTYVCVPGDNYWSIAMNHGMSEDALLAINNAQQGDIIQIGQEIKLTKQEPLIHVQIVKEQSFEAPIAYVTTIEETSELLKGETEVAVAGIPGTKQVLQEVTEVNGVVVAQNVIQEAVTLEPVAEVVKRGTSDLMVASRAGSGPLNWPKSGGINSPFGWRSMGNHQGIDIAATVGDPVGAAAGGTVTFAGYDGAYGYAVLINHGNGLETRYAHLSEISVNVGETIHRGELLGLAGNTGRSTGPHLHFEVIVGGVHQDPMNYLR